MPALMTLFVIGMPFLVHFGLTAFGPRVFASLLLLIFIPRILLTPADNRLFKILMLLLVLVYCGVVAAEESVELLLFYPVLMSSFFALLFFMSLFSEKTLIEEFVLLSGKSYPAEARSYMRGLTKAWTLLLLLNAAIAGYTACCQSAQVWLLYNGIIAYVIIFGFVIAEVVYRGIYRRRSRLNL